MNKTIAVFFSGMVAVILGALLLVWSGIAHQPVNSLQPMPLGGGFVTEIRTSDGCDCDTGSTSPAYLTTTGANSTSTIILFSTDGAESVDLNMQAVSSTTATQFGFTYEFSNDKVNFYGENGRTINSNTSVTESATTTTHYWTPGQTATSSKNITVTPVASKWMRIKAGVSGASGGLWIEGVNKKIIRN